MKKLTKKQRSLLKSEISKLLKDANHAIVVNFEFSGEEFKSLLEEVEAEEEMEN